VGIYRQQGMRIFTTIRDRVSTGEARGEVTRMVELDIDGIICNRVWLLRAVIGEVRQGPAPA